jgi:nucleotide-binding universal stress UspA family protein
MALYQHVGVAVALSPTLDALLAEVAFHRPHLAARLSLVHAGAHAPEKEARFREALADAALPPDTPIHWMSGPPEAAILKAVEQHQIDLLMAGALEKEEGLRYYLGSVARDLVREAPCSLFLFTFPGVRREPTPLRRIVVVTDHSETALVAFTKALRLAGAEAAEKVYLVRVLTEYGDAMALAEGVGRERAQDYRQRTRSEEEALMRDFVDAAGRRTVDVEPVLVEGREGVVVAQLAREREADLLVMPSAHHASHFFERLFPSDMEWVLREIPCTIWVARERLQ